MVTYFLIKACAKNDVIRSENPQSNKPDQEINKKKNSIEKERDHFEEKRSKFISRKSVYDLSYGSVATKTVANGNKAIYENDNAIDSQKGSTDDTSTKIGTLRNDEQENSQATSIHSPSKPSKSNKSDRNNDTNSSHSCEKPSVSENGAKSQGSENDEKPPPSEHKEKPLCLETTRRQESETRMALAPISQVQDSLSCPPSPHLIKDDRKSDQRSETGSVVLSSSAQAIKDIIANERNKSSLCVIL